MFYGQYENKLDEKNRVMLPKKLRMQIDGDLVYVLEYLDGILSIFKPEDFEKLAEKAETLPFTQEATRKYLRKVVGSAIDVPIDKMGRVQLPKNYVVKHNLGKDLTLIGVRDHIEIWNKSTYEEYEKGVDKEFDSLVENLFK